MMYLVWVSCNYEHDKQVYVLNPMYYVDYESVFLHFSIKDSFMCTASSFAHDYLRLPTIPTIIYTYILNNHI